MVSSDFETCKIIDLFCEFQRLPLTALFARNAIIVLFCFLLFCGSFIPVLMVSFFFCGKLHNAILRFHLPLMRILGSKELEPKTVIRMLRIVDFMSSPHAGFRCSTLFLLKKRHIVEVSSQRSNDSI